MKSEELRNWVMIILTAISTLAGIGIFGKREYDKRHHHDNQRVERVVDQHEAHR